MEAPAKLDIIGFILDLNTSAWSAWIPIIVVVNPSVHRMARARSMRWTPQCCPESQAPVGCSWPG